MLHLLPVDAALSWGPCTRARCDVTDRAGLTIEHHLGTGQSQRAISRFVYRVEHAAAALGRGLRLRLPRVILTRTWERLRLGSAIALSRTSDPSGKTHESWIRGGEAALPRQGASGTRVGTVGPLGGGLGRAVADLAWSHEAMPPPPPTPPPLYPPRVSTPPRRLCR